MTDKESEWVNGFGKIGGESGSQLWGGGGGLLDIKTTARNTVKFLPQILSFLNP